MSESHATPGVDPGGRIGPNALLQLHAPVEQVLGPGAMSRLLESQGVTMPSGDVMIDETDVARVHKALFDQHPEQAPGIAQEAGIGTARYISKNRIPHPIRLLLRLLPIRIAEKMLTRAISSHAWTFCGSGRLEVQAASPVRFLIFDNPFLLGRTSEEPVCYWHTAVFEELFCGLLRGSYRVTETTCHAAGQTCCTFEVARS